MIRHTDEDVLNCFRDQYNNILNGNDPILSELDESITDINIQLFELAKLKQSKLEEKQKYIRDRWYRYRLYDRILRMFNIKTISRSKKAYEYYLKYIEKKFKLPRISLDFNLDQFKLMLESKIKSNSFSNHEKSSAYTIVLEDLFGKKG